MICDDYLNSNKMNLRQFLPEADHGSVIITSRSTKVPIGHLIPMRSLNKHDSLEILFVASGREGVIDDGNSLAHTCTELIVLQILLRPSLPKS